MRSTGPVQHVLTQNATSDGGETVAEMRLAPLSRSESSEMVASDSRSVVSDGDSSSVTRMVIGTPIASAPWAAEMVIVWSAMPS